MKKYLKIFVLGTGLVLGSCSDSLLDTYTPGELTEEVAVQNSTDLSRIMATAYVAMTPTSDIEFNSIFTDEASIGFSNGGQGLNDNYAFLLDPSSGSANGIWQSDYIALAYANRVIKFADILVPEDAADEIKIQELKAEALTIRAHLHLQLLTYFSTDPKDMNALGAVLITESVPSSYRGMRATNAEMYASIDADLAAAEAIFTANSSLVSPLYANINFTKGLKAKAAAVRGDYANALIYANAVIDNSGLTLATFTNPAPTNFTSYASVFHSDSNLNSVEVIFKLKKSAGQTKIGGIWASVNSTVSGATVFEMGRSLYNEFNTTNFASATNVQVTAISGNNITIPGHTLIVGDMFMSPVSVPSTATTANGTSTSPSGALLGGKVYYVRSVAGAVITLTADPTVATPAVVSLTSASSTAPANAGVFPLTVKTNYGDIRYSVNVAPTSIIDYNYATSADPRNTDRIAIRKYPGTALNGNLVNDIKIMRLSEMYLIKAEAQIATGDLTGAATTLQTLRNARSNRVMAAPVFADATAAWKAVLRERRIELSFEGFRFIDLKRLGTLANEGILRDPIDCAVNGACGLPVTDYRFALPIPLIESVPNGAILAQQNPGY